MNKKLIFIIIGLILFSAITGGVYWLLSKSNLMPLPVVVPDEACGDGVCSEIEKFSKSCERDCGEEIIIKKPSIIKDIKVSSPLTPFESQGDLWFSTWADDDLYVSWGDGSGPNCQNCQGNVLREGASDRIIVDPDYTHHGLAQLKGALPNVEAEIINRFMPLSDNLNNSKPSSLLFYNNRLYAAIHYPLGNSDAGFIAYSDDYGKTFKYDLNSPWKKNSNFRSLFFINMGKNYELNKDGYVYAFGIGTEWDWDIYGNGKVYLARVPKNKIIDYSAWEYFIGIDNNNPKWSKDQSTAVPIEDLREYAQFSSIYHPGIERYLILDIGRGEYEGRLYESQNPWGPWILAGKWFEGKNSEWFGNYMPGIITKNTGSNTFYFTAAGQVPPDPRHPYGNYRLKIGEITMILDEETTPQKNKQHLGTLTDPGSMSNSLLTEIGAKWVNAGLWPQAKGYVDIQQVKSRVKDLKDNNFNALINFGISMGEDYILHTFMNPGNNDRWQRGDLTGYYGWLNDVVKNLSFDYKGEPAIIYYQMGTELEGPDWWPASKNGSVEDYAIMLRLAYKSMKAFNPKIQLILAGSYLTDFGWGGAEEGLKLEGPGKNYYLKVLDELALMESIEKNPDIFNKYRGNPYISEEEYEFLFAKDNYSRYFDAVDFHPSGDEKQDLEIPKQTSLIFEKLKEKGYPKLPLWITDVNDMTWPECGYPNNNEEAHSRAFTKRYITSRSYGAETFFWTTFINYPAGDVIAKCTGLVDPSDKLGEIKKRKAFYSYRLIADKIDFKEKSDIIKDGKTNNIFVYKFSEENQNPVYTAWHYDPSGSSKEKQVQINIGFNKAKITNMVPIDNDGNFQLWTQDAPGGIITLTLTNDPYLIEQISPEISQPV